MLREHAAAIAACLSPLLLVVAVVVATMGPAFWLPPPYPPQPDALTADATTAYAAGVQESTLARNAHTADPYGYGWDCCDTASRASTAPVPGARVVSVHSHLSGHDDRPDHGRAGYFYITGHGDVELHSRHTTGHGNPDVTVVDFRDAPERVSVTVRDGAHARTFDDNVTAQSIRRWNGRVNPTTLSVNATARRVPDRGTTTHSPLRRANATVTVGENEAVLVVIDPDGRLFVRVRHTREPVS